MTVADMWTRNYRTITAGRTTRHVYSWDAAPGDMQFYRVMPRHNDHPLWTYTPPASKSYLQIPAGMYSYAADWAPYGYCFRRVITPPGVDSGDGWGSWDFGSMELEEVWLCSNITTGFGSGGMVDENGIPLVWEFGGSDFSTPFPAWVFQDMPTHFRLIPGYAMRVQPLLADATGLRSESLQIPEMAHAMTETWTNPKRMRGNCGRVDRRLARMPSAANEEPENVISIMWDSTNGDLLGAESRARASIRQEQDATYTYGTIETPYILSHHKTVKPTIRFRRWTVVYDGFSTTGTWYIYHIGLSGRTEATIDFAGSIAGDYDGYSLVEYDAILDLSTLSIPAGTLLTGISAIGPGSYGEPEGILSGPEPVPFCDGGSRSGIGGSVYIPGRVLKLGRIPLDGSTPTAV